MTGASCTGCGYDGHDEDERIAKRRRGEVVSTLSRTAEVRVCTSIEGAAKALPSVECVASLVRRPLAAELAKEVASYLADTPRWPDTEHLHPLEASWDRIAVIDFSGVPLEHEDALSAAIAYGAGLPPRFSPAPASAVQGLSRVVSVLPEAIAAQVTRDATSLLLSLRAETRFRQYILRLELVQGDTCQKWHCDANISRSLVTYVGPGTICANEKGVHREVDGTVEEVSEEQAVQASAGDILIMKGGEWEGFEGSGCAHRAPKIGAKLECVPSNHRLVLKVDIAEDF